MRGLPGLAASGLGEHADALPADEVVEVIILTQNDDDLDRSPSRLIQ